METIDLLTLIIYFVVLLVSTFLLRPARNMNDYALGSREFPAMILFASLASTAIGPGFTTGLIGKAASAGLIWVIIFCFFSIQMVITGFFLAPRLRAFENAVTLGDIMEVRYGKFSKILTGIICVMFCIGIIGAIGRATGSFLHVLLNIDTQLAIIVSTLVVIVYSTFGGLKAVVFTDVLQFIILSLGIPLVLIFNLPKIPLQVDMASLFSFNPTGLKLVTFIGLAISFLLGEFLLPPYAARALAARTPSAAKKTFLLTGIFSALWFLCVGIIGLLSRKLVSGVSPDEVFFVLVKNHLPVGLTGLVVAALVAIIASSQDSFLNSASVYFVRDIISPLGFKLSKNIGFVKFICAIIGLLGMIFALFMPSIVDALLVAYSIWAPTIVVPLVAALLYPNISSKAGILGMLMGGLTTLIWSLIFHNPWGLNGLIPGLFMSFIGTFLGSLISQTT